MSYQYTADRFVACKAYSFDSAAGCVKQANSGDETSKLFRKVGATKHADTVCLTRCDAECFEEITCLPQSYHSPPTGRRFQAEQNATTECGGDCSGCFELEPCGKCCQASRPEDRIFISEVYPTKLPGGVSWYQDKNCFKTDNCEKFVGDHPRWPLEEGQLGEYRDFFVYGTHPAGVGSRAQADLRSHYNNTMIVYVLGGQVTLVLFVCV